MIVLLLVAIDGPAASGKSTIAKTVADTLKIRHIDSGLIYRAISLKIIRAGQHILECNEKLVFLLKNTNITICDDHIFLDGELVDDYLKQQTVNSLVAEISYYPAVIKRIIMILHDLVGETNSIIDGRNIGTAVFPNARFKFFITAPVRIRAHRRFLELSNNGIETSLSNVLFNIESRDSIDYSRPFAPLARHNDAIEINTDLISCNEAVNIILSYIDSKI